jgi:hypothetical protein
MRRLLAFVLLALPCYGCGSKETPRLTVDQIHEEYLRDPDKADAAYKDKIIIVTGKVGVKHPLDDKLGSKFLTLTGKKNNVICTFQDEAVTKKFKTGQTISVRGKSDNKGLGLRECEVESSEK